MGVPDSIKSAGYSPQIAAWGPIREAQDVRAPSGWSQGGGPGPGNSSWFHLLNISKSTSNPAGIF